MTSLPDGFRDIERRLIEQADGYRERHHSAKLSLYSGFFAFDGLTLAAAALLSTTGHTHRAVVFVLVLSLLSCIILFLQFHWLLTFYDRMGFTKISIHSEQDITAYYERMESDREYIRARKRLRRMLDVILFIFAFCQIGLIGYATFKTI
jgi:hypothetical protein